MMMGFWYKRRFKRKFKKRIPIKKTWQKNKWKVHTLKGAILFAMLVFCIFAFFLVEKEEDPFQEFHEDLTIKVYVTEEDKIIEMPFEAYLVGVLSKEISPSYPIEAIKAQAVAARTYSLRKIESIGGSGCGNHEGADICDTTHCQVFATMEALEEDWGENFDTYYEKLKEGVIATTGQVLVYDGKLIDALFHATSGGTTENSEDYYQGMIPYLRSVESPFEEVTSYNNKETRIPKMDFLTRLKEEKNGFQVTSDDLGDQITIDSLTEGGKVNEITIGNTVLSGREVREIFGLPSSGFTLEVEKKDVVFITNGYGHGVGMSQHGAKGMAEVGFLYDEILTHYYTDVDLMTLYHTQ